MADRGEVGTSPEERSTPVSPECSVRTDSERKKSVLVCLGERKREVSFVTGHGELETFTTAVRKVYSDVLVQGDETVVFQLKREEWGGEFTDLEGETVPDRAVIRAVVVHEQAGSSKEVWRVQYTVGLSAHTQQQ